MWSKRHRSNVVRSLLPCASISASGAFPLFCSAAYQISMLSPDRIHTPFSSKGNAQRGSAARLCHRPSTALPTCEAPTLPLCIDHMLLLITRVSNVCTRAYASYPSRDDTASPHGSDQSRSSRVCQRPLWLHSQTLHTYLHIRSGSFDVRAEVYY